MRSDELVNNMYKRMTKEIAILNLALIKMADSIGSSIHLDDCEMCGETVTDKCKQCTVDFFINKAKEDLK